MLKLIFIFTFLIVSFTFFQCKDQLTSPGEGIGDVRELNPTEMKIASSSESFGFNLFKDINKSEGDKNIFISPLSVSMALGMTLNGANGSTYDSMKSALKLNGLTQPEINESYKSLINFLKNIDPKVIFNIANSIWYRNTYTIEQNFINSNKNYFNAEVNSLDFNNPTSVDIINSWVNNNTSGRIKKIIDNISPKEIMFLINAIYFKGDWKYQFDKNLTADDYFTKSDGSKIQTKMMEQKNDFSYFQNDLFQAVDLSYGGSSFSMTIFLPNQNKDINSIVAQFNQANWENWLNSFSKNKGEVLLPKFELEYKIKLNDVLQSLGMGIAFSGFADFTKMYSPGGIKISKVNHKTYVKVDEEGTEAAAVTSVGIEVTSVGSSGFFMKMDRPFIFIIRERHSNSILFIGKLENPGIAH